MDKIVKLMLASKIDTDKKRLAFIKQKLVWALTHRGLVKDEDIFEHLSDIHDICFPDGD